MSMPPLTPGSQPSMRLLVTGAAGFLGRVMVREARAAGHEVWAAGRHQPAGSQALPIDWDQHPEVLAGHLHEIRPDCIIHGAGSASVAQSMQSPHEDLRASFGTWSHLLEAVRISKLKPLVIFPSSAAVYGDPESLPVREEAPLHPISPYGWHKMLCECLAREHHDHFGLPVVITRLFSVFGASQHRLLVWELFDRFRGSGATVDIDGTGEETRDFLSEWDVSSALLMLASKRDTFAQRGTPWIFNLASGQQRSILDMAHAIGAGLQSDKPIRCLNRKRPGDPLHWEACTERLETFLPEWRPLAFPQALQQTLHHWTQESTARTA
ncbi:NAD-dependent epimerase/dehydratase family protein [Roseimicrobium gellanilyticum]|nr:SDR family oxidoreductase [Roseimicrobium gellanilyticum]